MGSKGFGQKGKASSTWRHAEVTLKGLLENSNIIRQADLVQFEKRIENAIHGASEIDVQIIFNNRIINIETKAGIKFFNYLTSKSNFVTQTANGILEATSLMDFKVFLNEDLIESFSDAAKKVSAKKRVINAWKDMIDVDPNVQQRFIDFIDEIDPDFDLELKSIIDFLNENDYWFDEIFLNKKILP